MCAYLSYCVFVFVLARNRNSLHTLLYDVCLLCRAINVLKVFSIIHLKAFKDDSNTSQWGSKFLKKSAIRVSPCGRNDTKVKSVK